MKALKTGSTSAGSVAFGKILVAALPCILRLYLRPGGDGYDANRHAPGQAR